MLRKLLVMLGAASAAVLGLAALNLYLLLTPAQLEAQVRALLERRLAAPFDLASIELSRDGLALRGLVIYEDDGRTAAIRVAEARAPIDWERMALGPIRIERPEVRVHRDADGAVSLQRLVVPIERRLDLPLPELRFEVRGARVRYTDDDKLAPGQAIVVADADVDATLRGDVLEAEAVVREPWIQSARATIRADRRAREAQIDIEARKALAGEELYAVTPPNLRRLWDKLRPQGIGDVELQVTARPGERPEFPGRVLVHNGSVSFVDFPYRAGNVNGVIELSTGLIALRGLEGTHGAASYRGEGEVFLAGPDAPDYVDVRIEVFDLPVDRALERAMPPQIRPIYSRFEPSGVASGEVRVFGFTEPGEAEGDFHFAVDATLAEGAARFDELPIPVTDLRGVVRVRDKRFEIDHLQGQALGGSVEVTGAAAQGHARIRVDARGLEVDERAARLLRPEHGAILERLQPSGLLDARVEVTCDGPARDPGSEGPGAEGPVAEGPTLPIAFTAVLEPRRGFEAALRELPYPLTVQSGQVRLTADGAAIEGIAATGPHGGHVQVDGAVRFPPPEGGPRGGAAGSMALVVTGEAVPIDRALRAALAEAGARPGEASGGGAAAAAGAWLERLGLREGGVIEQLRFDVTAPIPPGGQAPGAPPLRPHIEGELRLAGVAATPEGFPYPFADLAAALHISPDALRVRSLTGRMGLGTIEARGTLPLAPPGDALPASSGGDGGGDGGGDATPRDHLAVQLAHVSLDEALRDALPQEARAALAGLELAGMLSGRAHLRLDPRGAGRLLWNAEAQVVTRRLKAGIDLHDIDATVRAQGAVDLAASGPPTLEGAVAARSVHWRNQPVDDLHFDVRADGQSLELSPIRGRFLGGPLTGSLYVRTDGSRRFGGIVALEGADLRAWSPGLETAQGRRIRGALAGRVAFDGNADPGLRPEERLRGSGHLHIRDARLWRLPLFNTHFDRASVELRLAGPDRFIIDQVEAQSAAISFLGHGEILEGRAQIKLVHELGRSMLDQVPLIGWSWRGLKGLLVQVEVSGPLGDPQIEVIPIPILLDRVRDLRDLIGRPEE